MGCKDSEYAPPPHPNNRATAPPPHPNMTQNSNMNIATATFDLKRVSVAPAVTYATLPSALQVSWTLLQQNGINVQAKHLRGLGKVLYLSGLTEAQVMDIYLLAPSSSFSQSTCLLSLGVYINTQGTPNYINEIAINDAAIALTQINKTNDLQNTDNTLFYQALETNSTAYTTFPYFIDGLQNVLSALNLSQATEGLTKYFDVTIGVIDN